VSEAYEIAEFIFDSEQDEPNTLKFINTGSIDPHRNFWGTRETRYLGSRYLHPRVHVEDLERMNSTRADQAKRPKIIAIGMGNVETFFDAQGHFIAGKTTSIIYRENTEEVEELAVAQGFLNSRVARFWFKSNFLAAGMAGLSPANLIELPVPKLTNKQSEELAEAVIRLQELYSEDSHMQIDDMIEDFYGLSVEQRNILAN
jgi:hypothetical protein